MTSESYHTDSSKPKVQTGATVHCQSCHDGAFFFFEDDDRGVLTTSISMASSASLARAVLERRRVERPLIAKGQITLSVMRGRHCKRSREARPPENKTGFLSALHGRHALGGTRPRGQQSRRGGGRRGRQGPFSPSSAGPLSPSDGGVHGGHLLWGVGQVGGPPSELPGI